jgi:hypothetical protein
MEEMSQAQVETGQREKMVKHPWWESDSLGKGTKAQMGKAGRGPQVNQSGWRGNDLLNSRPRRGKSEPVCLD